MIVVDSGASKAFMTWKANILPCLTRTVGKHQRFWCSVRGRCFSLAEMARGQGLNGDDFVAACARARVSRTMAGAMLGNTMSLNKLQRILVRAFQSDGLVKHGLKDKWPWPH